MKYILAVEVEAKDDFHDWQIDLVEVTNRIKDVSIDYTRNDTECPYMVTNVRIANNLDIW